MESTLVESIDWFNVVAGGLAIGLLVMSFLMMFTTIFTNRKRN